MMWTIILVVLWLKDGTPEPFAATLIPGAPCNREAASAVADYVVGKSANHEQFTGDLNFYCIESPAPVPDPAAPPAPHVPGPGET